MPTAINLADLKSHLCLREHLNQEECEKALLPTLEHASMVHSHLHHPTSDKSLLHSDTFDQTRNAIIYISLVVVVYVIVVMWLVSSNFRATLNAATNGALRGRYPHFIDSEDIEGEEALLVVSDNGNGQASCSTLMLFDEEKEGVEPV
ncbi:unnamed protein product [Lepeophtheirus salmonis]|uniref:(salmon louse) hypothetical protein n=1 Tax=Lepeophtheirus salmonis TaxID=72036 RepID=A0A0K2U7Y9_LEPSM|nr:unnamed protein product [Lepeophtheirus salmonis]CAF2832804.1 unnamed protein product [Lepeophtheirus salmonis]